MHINTALSEISWDRISQTHRTHTTPYEEIKTALFVSKRKNVYMPVTVRGLRHPPSGIGTAQACDATFTGQIGCGRSG